VRPLRPAGSRSLIAPDFTKLALLGIRAARPNCSCRRGSSTVAEGEAQASPLGAISHLPAVRDVALS
jgi:hypothetical protein